MDVYSKYSRYTDGLWVAGLTVAFWYVTVRFTMFRSLWSDELAGILTALRPLPDTLLQLQDYSAPLYPLVLKALIRSEYPPEWIVRLPALVFAVLSLVAVWGFVRKLFGRHTAAIAVLLMAVNPMFVRYAGEGRSYSMFLFFSVLSMFAFSHVIDRNKAIPCVLYIMATTLLIYTHYFGFLVLGGQVTFALSRAVIVKGDRLRWPMLMASFLAIVLLAIPALYLISRFYFSGAQGIVGWIERPQVIDLIWVRQAGELIGDSSLSVLGILAVAAAVINDGAAIRGDRPEILIEGSRSEKWWLAKEPALLCVCWIIFGLYLPMAISYCWRPIFIIRYGLPVMVPLIAIIAYAISRFGFRGMVVATLLLATLPAYNTFHYLSMTKFDYPATVRLLTELNDDRSAVYVTDYPYCKGYQNPELYGLRYYGYEGEVRLLTMRYPDFTTIVNRESVDRNRRVFVVAFNKWPAVEAYLKSDLRAYRLFHFGYMHLFEVEKAGSPGRWTRK